MNPAAAFKEKVGTVFQESARRPKILAATVDPEIRHGLTEALQEFSVDVIWLKSLEAARSILSREKIAACFCGFWLQDGTYRQLISQVRRMRVDTPVIIVSGPSCPDESAMNLGSIDFLAYPYGRNDLQRIFSIAEEIGKQSAAQESRIARESFAGEAA